MTHAHTPQTLPVTLRRVARRWLILLLLVGPAIVVLLIAGQPGTVTMTKRKSESVCQKPVASNNWCAPDSARVSQEIARQQSLGLGCSETPALDATLVFLRRDGTVTTVDFDEATRLRNEGWVMAFCR